MEGSSGPDEACASAPLGESKEAALRTQAALAELSQKVVQLTKVIVFLHTRSDGHDTRCAALKSDCEDEVRQVASAATASVDKQRQQTGGALTQRERWLASR